MLLSNESKTSFFTFSMSVKYGLSSNSWIFSPFFLLNTLGSPFSYMFQPDSTVSVPTPFMISHTFFSIRRFIHRIHCTVTLRNSFLHYISNIATISVVFFGFKMYTSVAVDTSVVYLEVLISFILAANIPWWCRNEPFIIIFTVFCAKNYTWRIMRAAILSIKI